MWRMKREISEARTPRGTDATRARQEPPPVSPSNCPRCSGRIYLDREDDDWACLVCGWRDVKPPLALVEAEIKARTAGAGWRRPHIGDLHLD